MPAIEFPTVSLHVDRHKIVTTLSSCGAEIEVTHVPEVRLPPTPPRMRVRGTCAPGRFA